jgi:hypothetical protein
MRLPLQKPRLRHCHTGMEQQPSQERLAFWGP